MKRPIEILHIMKLEHLWVFYLTFLNPIEHKEDYQKANNKNFLFQTGDENYIYDGDKVFSFETNDKIVNYSSDLGFNDIKFPYAYSENISYIMLHQKHFHIQEYETSTENNEYQYLYKKDDELKRNENEGIVEYGNDYKNCKGISAWIQ